MHFTIIAPTALSSFNNLSVNLLVKALLHKNLGTPRMLELPDAIVQEVSNNILNNIILNIILLAEYTPETNSYNYSEWFNLLFQFGSLKLSFYRYSIPITINKQILEKYI